MPTSVSLKKGFVSPQWEKRYDVLSANAAGSFVRALQIPAYNIDASYFCANTTSTIHQYDAICDSYMTLPASGIAGTFGAGACGRVIPLGPTGTFTAGTTTSGTTGLTINRDLRGFKIRITGGPGAGDERIIASNTLGANSVITVTDAFSATITSSSTYRLLTPRLWVFAPAATPGLGYWDYALSTWTAGLSVAGLTFTGTDGLMVSTASISGNQYEYGDDKTFGSSSATTLSIANNILGIAQQGPGYGLQGGWTTNQWQGSVIQIIGGTGVGQTRIISANTQTTLTVSTSWSVNPDATSKWIITKAFESSYSNTFSSTTTSVLTVTGPSWTVNQWANSQIRAVAGTGAGQVRTIASNTSATLTVSAVWTTNFDATTVWVIEGNDDNIYLAGNNAVALFKYTITGNTWSTVSPTAARAAAPGAGFSLNWVTGVNDAAWTSRSAIQNGRYLYSFRGAAGNVLDVYDIALVTWVSGKAYGGQNEVFTTGNCWEYDGINTIYGAMPTGRLIKFDVLKNEVKPLASQPLYTQGTATVGDKLFRYSFQDGPTRIDFLYFWGNTLTSLTRMLIFQTY